MKHRPSTTPSEERRWDEPHVLCVWCWGSLRKPELKYFALRDDLGPGVFRFLAMCHTGGLQGRRQMFIRRLMVSKPVCV